MNHPATKPVNSSPTISVPFNIYLTSTFSDIEKRTQAKGCKRLLYVGERSLSKNALFNAANGDSFPIAASSRERGRDIANALLTMNSTEKDPVTLVLLLDKAWVDVLLNNVDGSSANAMASTVWGSIERMLIGFATLRSRRCVVLDNGTKQHVFQAGVRLPASWVSNHPAPRERSPNFHQRRNPLDGKARKPSFNESIMMALKGHFRNEDEEKVTILPSRFVSVDESVLGEFIRRSISANKTQIGDVNRILHATLVSMTQRSYWNSLDVQRQLVDAGSQGPGVLCECLAGLIVTASVAVMTVEPAVDPAAKKLWQQCIADLVKAVDIEEVLVYWQ